MSWSSKAVTIFGAALLVHACYSVHEHSALAPSLLGPTPTHAALKLSLPLDIYIETVVATLIVTVGLVLSSPNMRPIRWNVWAGKVEREGSYGFSDKAGNIDKDFRGSPFGVLETRPSFVDIRKQRREFAEWAKGQS